MCDCVSLCLCLLGVSAAVSYFSCKDCINYNRLEADSKEPL